MASGRRTHFREIGMAIDIYLRAFELDDYKLINTWRKDDEIYRLAGGNKYFVSSERDRKWVEEKIQASSTELYLAIALKTNHQMIGYASLCDIETRNGRADWSGIVIGPTEHRGHGYASQAIYLLLEYAFDELRLHRVSGSWLDDHKVSQFTAQLMGFMQEGVLRDYVYKGGKYHDVLIMSILREEFEQLRKDFCVDPDRRCQIGQPASKGTENRGECP
jgi:ribosomal-protein-alanine N-acetyltransferase